MVNLHKEYFIKLCHTNNLYGTPCKVSYKNFTGCSPTNLRYILHGLLILSYIKTIGLTSTNIVEIGGGYDGLCFYIYNMAKLFDITRGDGFTRKVFTCPRFWKRWVYEPGWFWKLSNLTYRLFSYKQLRI